MVANSASFGHGSLVCGLWLAGGGHGGSVSMYVLGTFYIRFFVYQGYDIWKNRKANCSISRVAPCYTSYIRRNTIIIRGRLLSPKLEDNSFTLAACGLEELFSSCAVVSVFRLWWEIVLGVTYLPHKLHVAGGTFFPVVLSCQFLVLAGNRFWFTYLCT